MQNNTTKEQLKQKREILKSFDENFQNCLNDCHNALFGARSKMALIITHRMSSVKQADEIIVLDQGRLIEQGNFETLMKKQGLFYELFLKQQY